MAGRQARLTGALTAGALALVGARLVIDFVAHALYGITVAGATGAPASQRHTPPVPARLRRVG